MVIAVNGCKVLIGALPTGDCAVGLPAPGAECYVSGETAGPAVDSLIGDASGAHAMGKAAIVASCVALATLLLAGGATLAVSVRPGGRPRTLARVLPARCRIRRA